MSIGLKKQFNKIMYIIGLLVVVSLLYVMITAFSTSDWSFGLTNAVVLARKNVITYIISFLLMIPLFLLHELSHILVASHFGLWKNHFCFALYFGFIPMFYIKINGIYTIERKNRILVLSAGIIANIIFGFLFYVCYLHSNIIWLYSLSLASIRIGIVNLLPFSLTDGYFLLCNIIKKINLRKGFLILIRQLKNRHKIENLDKQVMIYAATSLIFTFCYIVYELSHVIRMLSQEINNPLLLLVGSIAGLAIYFIIITWALDRQDKKKLGRKLIV